MLISLREVLLTDEYADGGLYQEFFKLLGGGSSDDVAPAAPADDDVDHEKTQKVRSLSIPHPSTCCCL